MLKAWCSLFITLTVVSALLVPSAMAVSIVELKDIAFSYRPELEPFYKLEQMRLRNRTAGVVDKAKELAIYKELYEKKKGDDVDLTQWQPESSPEVFRIRVQVRNYGNTISKPTPVTVYVMAKVGEFLVTPGSFLVDMGHLEGTAEWMQVHKIDTHIPELSPGETYDWFSDPVVFGEFLNQLTHQYPVALRIEASIDSPQAFHKAMEKEIPVKVDNFALQLLPQQ